MILAYLHGTALEIFLEGATAIGAVFGAISVPLVVLWLLKRYTRV